MSLLSETIGGRSWMRVSEDNAMAGSHGRRQLFGCLLRVLRAREDVDQVSLGIAEDHAPISPRLRCRRQDPLDAECPDPLVFGVCVVDEEVEDDLGPSVLN